MAAFCDSSKSRCLVLVASFEENEALKWFVDTTWICLGPYHLLELLDVDVADFLDLFVRFFGLDGEIFVCF